MAPVDRNQPKRAASSESGMSVLEFVREFPDDETCLQWLWQQRHAPDGEHAYCKRCGTVRSFKRYHGERQRQVWTCTSCSLQISPTAGTIFHKSSTSLQLWFYAIWLMTSTRCGVSAKQLERELGVTYKTAWRMFNLIRNRLMTEDTVNPLTGEVEADETWIGGKTRNSDRRKRDALGWDRKKYDANKKTIVFAAVERDGRVRATIIPNSGGHTLRNKVREWVDAGSIRRVRRLPHP
jgi:transposase-like protein